MTGLLPLSECLPLETSENRKILTLPQLYLSSADAGWERLVARAFHELEEWEGWITSDTSDTSLTLSFEGRASALLFRQTNGESLHQFVLCQRIARVQRLLDLF